MGQGNREVVRDEWMKQNEAYNYKVFITFIAFRPETTKNS